MNKEISDIETKIELNKKEMGVLRDDLIKACYDYLNNTGVKKGCMVDIKLYDDYIQTGIFDKLVIRYNDVMPIIMKLKKDGTPHKTATIYCGGIDCISLHTTKS